MQVMCKCVHILRDVFCTAIEEVVRQYGRNRHKQADSSRYQSLTNRTGYRSNAHLTAFADADQGMVNTPKTVPNRPINGAVAPMEANAVMP